MWALGVGSNQDLMTLHLLEKGVHVVDLKQETIEANSRFFNNDINLVPKHKLLLWGIEYHAC